MVRDQAAGQMAVPAGQRAVGLVPFANMHKLPNEVAMPKAWYGMNKASGICFPS